MFFLSGKFENKKKEIPDFNSIINDSDEVLKNLILIILYIFVFSVTTGVPKCSYAGNVPEHNKEFSLHCNISNNYKIFTTLLDG